MLALTSWSADAWWSPSSRWPSPPGAGVPTTACWSTSLTCRDSCAQARTGRGELRILDVAQPLAYCLPGVRSRVVVSEGTLSTLDSAEVTAILTHERAHLRARHDLVLEAFTAVHAAFPRFVRSASALDAVRLLIELLADDAAVRTAGPTPLARALVACAAGRTPSGAMAAGGPTTVVRVRRLAGRPNSPMIAAAAYLGAVAVLVVPTVALAVPWLTELQRLLRHLVRPPQTRCATTEPKGACTCLIRTPPSAPRRSGSPAWP